MRIPTLGARAARRIRQHRRVLLLAVAVLAVATVAGGLLMFGWPAGSGGDSARGAENEPAEGAAPGSADDEPSSPGAETTAEEDPVGVTRLPEAAAGDEVDFGSGLIAIVTTVEQIDVEAMGPGVTSGPGVAVHLELRNESDDEVDLTLVSVDVSDAGGTPAAHSVGEPAEWVSGVLAPGESATGTYVFRVDGETSGLRVDIFYAGSPNIVVIRT